MKIEIKCWFSGKVLFEHTVEGNSLRLTVEKAVEARAYLAGADLAGADLTGAYSAGAYLAGANLAGAYLAEANLARAYLAGAYLADANLAGANLAGADLAGADLTGADLTGANLVRANLARAYLAGANLAGADLTGANLVRANLTGAENAEQATAQTVLTPEGAFIGWKSCNQGVLVKLLIPAEARRSNASGRKCRAEFVDVLEVIGAAVGVTNSYGPPTEYRAGQRVHCHKWDDCRWNECSGGIHFFITRAEAEAWGK